MELLLDFIVCIAILILVVVLYCALIPSGRRDECGDRFYGEEMCPECKMGKYTYELDPDSGECPYISCCKNGKCPYYIPLKNSLGDDK